MHLQPHWFTHTQKSMGDWEKHMPPQTAWKKRYPLPCPTCLCSVGTLVMELIKHFGAASVQDGIAHFNRKHMVLDVLHWLHVTNLLLSCITSWLPLSVESGWILRNEPLHLCFDKILLWSNFSKHQSRLFTVRLAWGATGCIPSADLVLWWGGKNALELWSCRFALLCLLLAGQLWYHHQCAQWTGHTKLREVQPAFLLG